LSVQIGWSPKLTLADIAAKWSYRRWFFVGNFVAWLRIIFGRKPQTARFNCAYLYLFS